MSLWKKIMALVKLNKVANEASLEIEKVKLSFHEKKNGHSGLQSTEFWMTLLASLGSILASASGAMDPLYGAICVSLSTVFYTLSRGIVKNSIPGGGSKPGYKTSEFFVGLLTDLGALLAAISGAVKPEIAAALITISRISYSISRALSK